MTGTLKKDTHLPTARSTRHTTQQFAYHEIEEQAPVTCGPYDLPQLVGTTSSYTRKLRLRGRDEDVSAIHLQCGPTC